MINEEDHLRIQVLGPGFCLQECLEKAIQIDDILDEALSYAFNEKLGFLTNCPTNLGTGLRASVMLHLPALTRTGALREFANTAGKLGFAVRGMYGEGSAARAEMVQLSNQFTLGFSESEIVQRMRDYVQHIIQQERGARAGLKKQGASAYEDRIWRAYGLLSSARLMTSQEAETLLSELRLGAASGVVEGVTPEQIDRLLVKMQPMTLSLNRGGENQPARRDEARAELIRKELA
jgi:protein arginine kinase